MTAPRGGFSRFELYPFSISTFFYIYSLGSNGSVVEPAVCLVLISDVFYRIQLAVTVRSLEQHGGQAYRIKIWQFILNQSSKSSYYFYILKSTPCFHYIFISVILFTHFWNGSSRIVTTIEHSTSLEALPIIRKTIQKIFPTL